MTYSSRFVQIRFLGYLGNNTSIPERWQAGLKLPLGVSPSSSQLTSFLQAIKTPTTTFHTTAGNGVGSNVFFTEMTAAYIDTDGKYVGGGAQSTVHEPVVSQPTGAGSGTLPWSTSMVISLRTQFSRGLASNGRVYWPCLGLPVTATTGLWSTTAGTSWANSAKTWIDAINTAAASTLSTSQKISVMSQVGTGTLAPVTQVRCGLKPDRQERRERDLDEGYIYATLATTADVLETQRTKPIGQR